MQAGAAVHIVPNRGSKTPYHRMNSTVRVDVVSWRVNSLLCESFVKSL